jgi:antitoxin component YwqK of YwqJK toxin-antitoxin module
MKKFLSCIILFLIVLNACTDSQHEPNETEKREKDSLSKIAQKRKADSLKSTNPFYIVPPDSDYSGDYVDKYKSGIIKFRGFFRFGKRHGAWMSFYPSGIIWSECHYDKGLKQGPITTYFENGQKRFEGFYREDLQDSLWTYYDSTGKVLSKIVYKEDRVSKRLPVP